MKHLQVVLGNDSSVNVGFVTVTRAPVKELCKRIEEQEADAKGKGK